MNNLINGMDRICLQATKMRRQEWLISCFSVPALFCETARAHAVLYSVEALCYRPDGREFCSPCDHWILKLSYEALCSKPESRGLCSLCDHWILQLTYEALWYKAEGRGLESQWGPWLFSVYLIRHAALVSAVRPLPDMVAREEIFFFWNRVLQVRKAVSLTHL
jgi:hypothetical protein